MIYFVRHGLSEANVKKVFAGQKDDSILVDEGRIQAKETANIILAEGIKIEKIVSSPAKRALETAEIIAKEINFISPIIIDNRINEFDMGELSGKPWGEISSAILVNAPSAENPNLFHDRVLACVKELEGFSGNILLVSHAGVGRMLETIKIKKDPSTFYDIKAYKNASVTKIDWIK